MKWITIKSTFLGICYGSVFAIVSYLSTLGYFAHRDTHLTLQLDQQEHGAAWHAQDPLYKISIQNTTSVIGSTPTVIIEKQRSWSLIAACTALGLFVGYATYRSKISTTPTSTTQVPPQLPSPALDPAPEPTPDTQP